jgi:4-hydroxybenzoate polyprenyltransferase
MPRGQHAPLDPLSKKGRPLVVDLNEVLIYSKSPSARMTTAVRAMIGGVASFIGRSSAGWAAGTFSFEPARAVFDEEVMAFLLQTVAQGRLVYLCSDSYSESFVNDVAGHLGLLTAWSAVDEGADRAKADLPLGLRQGFDYLGNGTIELACFESRATRPGDVTSSARSSTRVLTWVKLLRVHQYTKNALVLVPLLTAHKFSLESAGLAVLAALAFSLCASSAYILNDLLDVEADRAHPTKRNRPIASGAISSSQAICVMVVTLVSSVAIAGFVSMAFCGILACYLALTTAYSFWLKRAAIIDVVTLAMLYTIRVIGGAIAIGVTMSEWLFAFSLFIFMSLALVKRYIELVGQPQSAVLAARDYRIDDRAMVAILAAGAGFNAVVVFTLYISSETVRGLYTHPQLLWINIPILMYWIARVMLLAQRGLIDDDPVIFALKDRVSWIALAAIGATMLAAI